MRPGLYFFASLALIALIGALTYTINPDYYAVEMLGINFSFPIAIWIVLPMILLFILTLGHMFFYGLKNYFILRKWQKDTNTLEEGLYWALLNEPKEQKYAMRTLGDSAILLENASITVSENVDGLSPRLSRVVNMIQKIKNGKYIDLKEKKMLNVFNAGNPILIQNRLNRLESDEDFVEGVMKDTSKYSKAVQSEALGIFARKEDFVKARKYAKVFDVKNFLVMLGRISYDDDLGITPEILTEFVEALNLKCADYIKIVLVTKKYFKPEENLILFRDYQIKNEKAQNAYLYLLFEYELLDQAASYLVEQNEDEFMKFRALYTLKKEHNIYKLVDIIDIDSICNKTKIY